MKKALAIFLMCFTSVFILAPLVMAVALPDYIYVFDYRNPDIKSWNDKFEDDASTNARIYLEDYPEGKIAIIEGISDKESFGCVYQDLTVDLDKYPVMEIDVTSVSKKWYIILQSGKLQEKETDFDGNQFVRVQFDTDRTGQHKFDLKTITGLSGEQTFRLKLGIATGDVYVPAEGVKMLFRTLRLVGTK